MVDNQHDDEKVDNVEDKNVKKEERKLAPHELGKQTIIEEEQGFDLIEWVKGNKMISSISALLVTILVIGAYLFSVGTQNIVEASENVVPHRVGYEDTSQQFIANDKVIEGGAKGTITTVDNQMGGAKVSAPWIAIDATGNDKAATLAPPEDLTKVGWYGRSAWFGQDKGSTVMTSHINYNGIAYFGSIFLTLKKGDPITITDEKGNTYHYVVEDEVQWIEKQRDDYASSELIKNTVNKMDGENKLVLITCGGRYVGGALGYESNGVVSARLASNTEAGIRDGSNT